MCSMDTCISIQKLHFRMRKKSNWLPEKFTFLDIKGTQFRAPLKTFSTILALYLRCFRGVRNWVLRIPGDASLSNSCPDRCKFPSLTSTGLADQKKMVGMAINLQAAVLYCFIFIHWSTQPYCIPFHDVVCQELILFCRKIIIFCHKLILFWHEWNIFIINEIYFVTYEIKMFNNEKYFVKSEFYFYIFK